jgi:hypothetical protein
MFDRNRVSQQKQTINKTTKNAEIGTVTKVFEHIGDDDTSNFEVNVQLEGGVSTEDKVPVEFDGSSAIDVPKVGDKVTLDYRDDGKQAFVTGTAFSSKNRPPVGRAGVYRREYESGFSPAGLGNLYLSANTTYANSNPAVDDVRDLTPASSVIRLAKREDGVPDPNLERDVPAKIEFFDSTYVAGSGESHISIELNRKSSTETDKTWGAKFDLATGGWQLADPKGFGIEANGDGTFTWHVKKGEGNLNFKEHDSDTGPLDL